MITLTDSFGMSVTINPAQVTYVVEGADYTIINFAHLQIMVKEPYLDVVGMLRSQSGGCCR